MSGDISLGFLGQSFLFPADIDDFVRYTLKFNIYEDRLLDVYNKAYEQNKWHNASTESISYYKTKMLQITNDVAQDLAKDKITFGNAVGFINNSDGYRMLFKVCEDTTPHIRKLRSNYMLTKPELEAQTNTFLKEEYFPVVLTALRTFCNELLQFQLKAINDAGVYDFSRIKEYDIKASFDALRELEGADDKRAVLIKAFELCPFNSEIYIIALHLGLADISTFETAKYLGIDHAIKDKITAYCIENVTDEEKIRVAVTALSVFSSTSYTDALDSVYRDTVKSAKDKFLKISGAIGNNIALEMWIKKHLCHDDIEGFLGTSDAVIFEMIDKYIDSVMSVENFYFLSGKTGVVHTDFENGSDYHSYEDYIIVTKDKLSERVRWLLDKIAEDRYKQENADSVFDKLSSSYNQFNGDTLARLEKRVERLKDQIIMFGIIDAFRGGRLFIEYAFALAELEAYKKDLENIAGDHISIMHGIRKEEKVSPLKGFGLTTVDDFIEDE